MRTTCGNLVVLGAFLLLVSADGAIAQRVRNENRPAAPAAAAPTVTGKIVAYEPGKTITLETTARNGVKRSEFTIDKDKTKIELPPRINGITVGITLSIWADQENPTLAVKIGAGANNAPRQRGNPANVLSGTLQGVDVAGNTVTVATSNRATGKVETTYELAKDVEVLRDGKPAKASDLKQGSRITVKLSADQTTAVSLSETGKTLRAPLKSVDPEKNSITLTVTTGGRNAPPEKKDVTHELAKDGKVTLEGKEV
ncbi:MAG: hypothetical protein L0Z07_05845, partial [Planctomycetes bacterium]|nr:hypothetical protein [Planctomycetota bacterium]